MNKQICQNCGTEIPNNFSDPLVFCTNCGFSLIDQGYGTDSRVTKLSPHRKTSTGFGKKLVFGLLILIPLVVILAGIVVGGIFVKLAIDKARTQPASPDYPILDPSTTKPASTDKKTLSFGSDGLGQGQFKKASAIAVGKDGNIYVGDGTLRIQKFDPEGNFLQLWNVSESSVTADESYSKKITDLAIDGKNTLYAVVEHTELLRYNGNTGEFIDKIALYGDKFVGKTMEARVLDVFMQADDKLAIFATSFPDSEFIYLVSPDGKVQTKHKNLLKDQSKNSTPLMSGNILISTIGDIFLLNGVVITDKTYIYHFKSDGTYVDRFTWEGAPTMGISTSKMIALNSNDEIYAYNKTKRQINIVSPDGVFQKSIPVGESYFEKMILDAKDEIYILTGNKVQKFPGS